MFEWFYIFWSYSKGQVIFMHELYWKRSYKAVERMDEREWKKCVFFILYSTLVSVGAVIFKFPLAALWQTCHLFKNKLSRLTFSASAVGILHRCNSCISLLMPKDTLRTSQRWQVLWQKAAFDTLGKRTGCTQRGAFYHTNQLVHLSLKLTSNIDACSLLTKLCDGVWLT